MLSASRFDAAAIQPMRHFEGRIAHAYRLAAYLTPTDGGDLVVLAVEAAGGQPNGINIPDGPDLGATCPAGARVSVDLAHARSWSSRLPADPMRISAAALRGAREAAARRAPKDGFGPLLRGDGVGDGFARAAERPIRALQSALAEGAPSAAAHAAADLVGLGVGLTPSGDDLLVGLLAGLEVVDDPARRHIAGAVVEHAMERTSLISASALSQAARGRYAERLHDVLAAIVAGEGMGIEGSIEAAMRYGATSGADTLVGLFIGLQRGLARRQRLVPAENAA
jgi:hypothetical protein